MLAQRRDGSPQQLTERLRRETNVAVLGTASFWEGVDVAGEALSLLVITRLPFTVPTDPVFAARSELRGCICRLCRCLRRFCGSNKDLGG